ncbi:MAG: hypothetical protein ACMG6H_01215 [Acidobacteriota bacterium]
MITDGGQEAVVGGAMSKKLTGKAHKLAKSEFVEHVTSRKNYYVKGRGPNDKKKEFEKWFAANFRRTKD